MPKRRLHSAVAAALAVAVLAPAAASAQDRRRVGIVVTVAVNLEPAQARQLATELGDAIEAALPVTAIAGTEVERRLPPAGLPEECIAEAECRNELGRRLDADELLFLVMVRLGERIQIDATWADVASGRVASQPRVEIAPGQDRAAALSAAVGELLPHIDPRPGPETSDRDPEVIVIERGGAESGRRVTAPVWIALGVAGAAAAGGSLFGLSARSKFESLERDCPACSEDDIERGERHALYADLLFAGAAAGVATAAVLYYLSEGERDAAGPAVSVGASRGSLAVTLGGRF